MIDLPTKAEVYCSDGTVGRSTYVIGNPINRQITHLVVKSNQPPFHEALVPVDQVQETTPDRVKLKCTRIDFEKMEPFEYKEYLRTERPGYLYWPYALPVAGYISDEVDTYITVKRRNIPMDELALHRGAWVEATDGYVGQVDELLINSNNMQVTHLVLLERHILKPREITIPVSQIDRVDEDTIYLKLDRQSVEELPTTPIQRWPLHVKDSTLNKEKIMDKILVVVFDGESKAYEGSRALQELQNEGSLNLYSKAVIARDAGGKVAVKQAGDMGPVGTAVGLLTGSLIGLLGGPVGLILGAGTGLYGGLIYDLASAGVGEDFLNEVGRSLQPGKAAVVAEVWEDWVLPVDNRMQALGGVVLRRMRDDILDAYIERDVAALNAELAELKAESNQASGDAKARLRVKIDAARAKLQAMQDGIQARLKASTEEAEAKLNSLREQAAKGRGERKARLERRMAELQAEQERRSNLLHQAGKLIKEALSI